MNCWLLSGIVKKWDQCSLSKTICGITKCFRADWAKKPHKLATDKTDPSTRSPYLNNTAPSEKNISSANSVEEKDRTPKVLSDLILEKLQEAKSLQICRIDLQGKSSLTDLLLICEGRSHLHSRGIAERVLESLKKTGIRPQGVEGEREGNWILLDYGEVILHVFHPVIRKYYDLEGLHSGSPIETWNDPAWMMKIKFRNGPLH